MPARNRFPTVGGRRVALLTLGFSALLVASCQDKPELVEPSDQPAATAPAWTSAPATASAAVAPVTFVGAGDIADCSSSGDEATAQLLDGIPGTVFTTGDNVYDDGSALQFTNCYNPTWGRHKARTRPVPGNHDYHISNAADYFAYYGANAGPAGRGYYSYDLGAWHVVGLNSEVSMAKGSPQEVWLRQDLAASTAVCTVALWHKPRWSSGTNHGSNTAAHPIWKALWEYGVDLVLEGHEHNYERFAPLDSTFAGTVNTANGIRSFVVGTGGRSHYAGVRSPRLTGSEVFNGSAWGVLKLTLSDSGYTWQFVPVSGQTFTDAGSASCHGKPGSPTSAPPPPSSTPTLKAIGVSPVSATLDPAATQQFTAVDTMSDGSTKSFAGTWAATGGTVSAGGTYTAGNTAGAYRLIASEGSKADTVQVTINAPSTGSTPPPPPPSGGSVVPGPADRVVLTPGDTVQLGPLGAVLMLTARAFNGSQEVATPVKWWSGSDKAATFNTSYMICTSPCSMAMTAAAVGITKVIIHEYRNGSTAKTDTSWVKVTTSGTPVPPSSQPPPPSTSPTLAQVIVTPGSVSLATGASQQFSASGVMSDGSTATLSGVSWSATGGSVSSGGSYTAGTTAGTFRVIGASGGKADTSSVTITAPSTSPPPPPPPSSDPLPSYWVVGCPSSGFTRLVPVSTAGQLASALSNAQPGDQIRLAAGTYNGRFDFNRAGTAGARITLCGTAGAWPVVTGGRFRVSGSFLTITGIVFAGPNGSDVNVYLASPHDILFTHNIVRNSDWHAGLSCEGSYNVTISYNYFHHNGGVSGEIDHGIYYRAQNTTPSTRNLIANNVITTSVGRGISMHDNGGGAISYTTVTGNTIVRNGSTGILVATNAGSGNVIANNVIADNGITYSYKQIRIKTGSGNSILNNIVWSPTSGRSGIEIFSGTSNTISGNLQQDPQFVSAYSDLHLRTGSPAIGMGLSSYSVSPDYDGLTRDGTPSAGAYEQ